MQGLEHEAVAAERDNDICFCLRGFAIATDEGGARRLGQGCLGGGEGNFQGHIGRVLVSYRRQDYPIKTACPPQA